MSDKERNENYELASAFSYATFQTNDHMRTFSEGWAAARRFYRADLVRVTQERDTAVEAEVAFAQELAEARSEANESDARAAVLRKALERVEEEGNPAGQTHRQCCSCEQERRMSESLNIPVEAIERRDG